MVNAPDALLALNNAHATETSYLDAPALDRLLASAFLVERAGDAARLDAFLIALDQDADYHSPNFLWFRRRCSRFVYVDRVVVAPDRRRLGLARGLYRALFARATAAGHDQVVCEVNAEPPNPGSDAFHAVLGFEPVGSARLAGRDKTVRYLRRRVEPALIPAPDAPSGGA